MTIAQDIKRQANICDLVSYYGFDVDRAGFINCPFHEEKTASLKLFTDTNRWHCFGCGKNGTVIDFVMQLLNISFYDACLRIAQDFGLVLEPVNNLSFRQREKRKSELRKIKQKAKAKAEAKKQALERYHMALDRFIKNDLAIMHSTVLSDEWCAAIKDRATAEFYLDVAEMEVAKLRGNRFDNTGGPT